MAVTHKRVRAGDWSSGTVTAAAFVQHAPSGAKIHDFNSIYEQWFGEVARWIRAMGGPDADRDDLVQDVFIVVHRRLVDFDGENLPGWLYRIAAHRVRDFLRLRWVQHFFKRGVPLSDQLAAADPTPALALESKEKRLLIERLLLKLETTQRAAFVLFEVEGYSGEEIARIQQVPLNTVWARIQRARKKMRAQLLKAGLDGSGGRRPVGRPRAQGGTAANGTTSVRGSEG
jgi:RNA polymerase sigma-70 factor (ECF subfamily)